MHTDTQKENGKIYLSSYMIDKEQLKDTVIVMNNNIKSRIQQVRFKEDRKRGVIVDGLERTIINNTEQGLAICEDLW